MFKKWHSKKQKYIKKIHSFLLFCHRDTFLNGMNTLKDLGINSTLFIYLKSSSKVPNSKKIKICRLQKEAEKFKVDIQTLQKLVKNHNGNVHNSLTSF